jgi:hypothetical protein
LPLIHFPQYRFLLYLSFRVRIALPKNQSMKALYLLAVLTVTLNGHTWPKASPGKKTP